MHFLALATDYDGTIAQRSAVAPETIAALRRLRESGRRLILVTGRELEDLRRVLPEMDLFDSVVAENGGVLHDPASGAVRALAPPPPPAFVEMLMRRGVEPISVGHTIVATWVPHEAAVLAAIEELQEDLQIIFNKGAIMVLPAGINKATGLAAALDELGLSPLNSIGVGDAENDRAFLATCGLSAAVANALDAVKSRCDLVLRGERGAGVVELVDRIMDDDLGLAAPARLGLAIGMTKSGEPVYLPPGTTLLVTGGSGTGKSNFATFLTERMVERGAEFCVVDPEGDYETLEDAVAVGGDRPLPSEQDLVRLVERTGLNLVLGLHGSGACHRREQFLRLMPHLARLRERTGRPHWLVIDEAHQFLPRDQATDTPDLGSAILLTVDPEWLARSALAQVDAVLAFGQAAGSQVRAVADALGVSRPATPAPAPNEALYWYADAPAEAQIVTIAPPRQAHHRHKGKYAIGDVGDSHAFVFTGPGGQPLGTARNLADFLRLAGRCGDRDWDRHLRSGDFTAWFHDVIRDEELGRRAMALASDPKVSASESRALIRDAIVSRYLIPDDAG